MDFKKEVANALESLGLVVGDNCLNLFEVFYKELIGYNLNVNLTAITEQNDFIYKHIFDSLIPFSFFANKKLKVLDIGAGAGFPSIPLKICNDNLEFVCIDSVNKKVNWLEYIKNRLFLNNFKAIHGRCEELAQNALFREKFDCVVARGVANLSTLLEYCAPFAKTEGFILAYKGANAYEELEMAKNAIKLLNLELFDEIKFNNKELGDRNIFIFKKTGATSLKYPRKQNKPRLSPL